MRVFNNIQLTEAAGNLAGNQYFKVFLSEIQGMREQAIAEATNLEWAEQMVRTRMTLGEVRAYDAILSLCDSVGISDPID